MSLDNYSQNEDVTDEMNLEEGDVQTNKVFAILAYIGILVLIPIFAAPKSKFARFHANQGLVLFIFEVAYNIVVAAVVKIFFLINWGLGFAVSTLFNVCQLAFLALLIIGIINAAQGRAKSLPVIGGIHLLK